MLLYIYVMCMYATCRGIILVVNVKIKCFNILKHSSVNAEDINMGR